MRIPLVIGAALLLCALTWVEVLFTHVVMVDYAGLRAGLSGGVGDVALPWVYAVAAPALALGLPLFAAGAFVQGRAGGTLAGLGLALCLLAEMAMVAHLVGSGRWYEGPPSEISAPLIMPVGIALLHLGLSIACFVALFGLVASMRQQRTPESG